MKTSTSLSVHRVWFRRWNRHNYSTFCSIGKCVNIGSVRKEIADKSLKKGLSITSTDTIVGNMERSDKPSEEEHTAGSFFLPEILATTNRHLLTIYSGITAAVSLYTGFFIF